MPPPSATRAQLSTRPSTSTGARVGTLRQQQPPPPPSSATTSPGRTAILLYLALMLGVGTGIGIGAIVFDDDVSTTSTVTTCTDQSKQIRIPTDSSGQQSVCQKQITHDLLQKNIDCALNSSYNYGYITECKKTTFYVYMDTTELQGDACEKLEKDDLYKKCIDPSQRRRLQAISDIGTNVYRLGCPENSLNITDEMYLDITIDNLPIRPVTTAGIYYVILEEGTVDGSFAYFYIDENVWIEVFDTDGNTGGRVLFQTSEMALGFEGGAGISNLNTEFVFDLGTEKNTTVAMVLSMARMYSDTNYADSYYGFVNHSMYGGQFCATFKSKLDKKYSKSADIKENHTTYDNADFVAYIRTASKDAYF